MFKKKPIKKIFESASIESADVNPHLPESAQDQSAETPVPNPQEGMEISGGDQASASEESIAANEVDADDTESGQAEEGSEGTFSNPEAESQAAPSAEGSSSEHHLPQVEEEAASDDILEDVRRALIEEEESKGQKESKWWRRIGRKSKTAEPEQAPAGVEMDMPAMTISADVADVQEQGSESDEELLNELIDALQTETEDVPAPPTKISEVAEALPEPEPEPEIDFEQLKEQALGPRPPEEEPEELSNVRSIALGGDEEVFVEVQPQATDTFDEQLKGFENALRPYRRYIYTALALLGAAVAVVAALIMFNVYRQSTAQPVTTNPNLPFPAAVSLPGGWSFKLGRGSLQDGKWEPQGAEWLQGTEVCRWVALPWSRQLEAVIRTLNPKDPIELVMSNNDKLTYKVYSVRQLSPEDMQKLDSNSPCLLLILTQPDSEQRWVLTAVP